RRIGQKSRQDSRFFALSIASRANDNSPARAVIARRRRHRVGAHLRVNVCHRRSSYSSHHFQEKNARRRIQPSKTSKVAGVEKSERLLPTVIVARKKEPSRAEIARMARQHNTEKRSTDATEIYQCNRD